jgi:hypothetical protein
MALGVLKQNLVLLTAVTVLAEYRPCEAFFT